MALTRTQIISQALTLLGKKPIMSLINQSDIVTALDQAFDPLIQSTLSTGNWRFAGTIVELALLVTKPIGGYYLYAYQLPADFLKLIHLWPQNYDFEVYQGNQIYSNYNNGSTPLFLDYIFMPLIQNLPPYFVKYFYYELATNTALANAQRPDFYEALKAERNIVLAQAQAADAQNRPQTPLQSQPMLTRRFVSTYASG
jgi:hypothetical protein